MPLFIVATPIGNLADITMRAIEVLKNADLILAEDTRVTKKLTEFYGIETKIESYNEHTKPEKDTHYILLLKTGKNIALVSDAGTPGIADPGARLVAATRKALENVSIVPIPGASSVTALMSVSGVRSSKYTFHGFVPHKKGRETFFKTLDFKTHPQVFFESPHRILKTLEQLDEHCDDVQILIGRELTKVFEEVIQGAPNELLQYFKDFPDKVRGEFVVLVKSGILKKV